MYSCEIFYSSIIASLNPTNETETKDLFLRITGIALNIPENSQKISLALFYNEMNCDLNKFIAERGGVKGLAH